jgi:hypothetical protein
LQGIFREIEIEANNTQILREKGESSGKGERKTFNPYPLTFSLRLCAFA